MSKTNEPAFPQLMDKNDQPGLTKREYFAGLAMQGMRAASEKYKGSQDGPQATPRMIWCSNDVASLAVQDADALLAALKAVEK